MPSGEAGEPAWMALQLVVSGTHALPEHMKLAAQSAVVAHVVLQDAAPHA
jgi:hypothetical protein